MAARLRRHTSDGAAGRRPGFRLALLATLILPGVPVAWDLVIRSSGSTGHLVTRAAVTLAALITMVACAAAMRGSGVDARRGWLLLALTAVCWSASNLIAAINEVLNDRTLPVPSPADIPSALALILAALAILSFLNATLSSAARMRTLLDGLLIGSALVFVGWSLVIQNLYASTGEGQGRVLALAYPVGDIVLVALVLVGVTRVRRRGSWILLASGLTLLSIGHAAFAYLEVGRAYAPGGLESFSWIAGCLLIGLAALSHARFEPAEDELRAGTIVDLLVPIVPVALAGAVALRRITTDGLDTFLLVNGGVIVVLLVVRQLLAQLEYLELNRQLEGRVEERTGELARQEQQFRAVVQNASDVVTVADSDYIIRYQSASCERILGYRFGELVGTSVADLFHPQARDDALATLRRAPAPPAAPVATELLLRRKDGGWTFTETTVSNLVAHEHVRGLLITSRDVGQRKALEDQLRQQALTDPLTGLGNRILFTDRLRHAVERAGRNPENLAVLQIDLDGFKQVNDSLGHSAGDMLLVEVAKRLLDSVRTGDTVARMGGDEFAVLLERASEEAPEVVAQRVVFRLRAPVMIGTKPLVVQGSVGIATGASTAMSAEDLLRNADLAMYEAKSKGKGTYEVFAPQMHSAALERVELETELRDGIRKGELILHYQPVVQLPSGRISGAEALVRWEHPTRGLVPPDHFIPIAEESDLVVNLGRWVLHEACFQGRRIRDEYPSDPPFSIHVNVAARQLLSQWLVKEVRETLEETGLPPDALVLEITEGALMSDPGPILATLTALNELGVSLAIDDFGTGWSSLSRLRSFPVHKLKIDKSFINEVSSHEDEAPIVAAIVAMAHSLHLTTVAEGVETFEQLACLANHGVEEVQGYLISKPLKLLDFEHLLRTYDNVAEAIPEGTLTRQARDYVDVVAQAAAEGGDLSSVVRPMLAELRRVTKADAAFLTEIMWDRGTEQVRFASSAPDLNITEGFELSWSTSPSRRAVEVDGPAVVDMAAEAASHELAHAGAATVTSVPVRTPEGTVFGALCVASARQTAVSSETTALLEMFARLVGEHTDLQPADASHAGLAGGD